MNKIICQACVSKPEGSGCGYCGGYGALLERSTCACGNDYWTRPGVHTMYEGKKWISFDGHRLVMRGGEVCCAKESAMSELRQLSEELGLDE